MFLISLNIIRPKIALNEKGKWLANLRKMCNVNKIVQQTI